MYIKLNYINIIWKILKLNIYIVSKSFAYKKKCIVSSVYFIVSIINVHNYFNFNRLINFFFEISLIYNKKFKTLYYGKPPKIVSLRFNQS